MMLPFGLLLYWRATQEIVLFLFLFAISRAFGVVAFHLHSFLVGKLRQVANKAHQLPAILLRSMLSAECGHACEAHSIFDYPKKFAVGEVWSFLLTHVRRLWIKIVSHHPVSAAVGCVADGAIIGVMQSTIPSILLRFLYSDLHLSGV